MIRKNWPLEPRSICPMLLTAWLRPRRTNDDSTPQRNKSICSCRQSDYSQNVMNVWSVAAERDNTTGVASSCSCSVGCTAVTLTTWLSTLREMQAFEDVWAAQGVASRPFTLCVCTMFRNIRYRSSHHKADQWPCGSGQGTLGFLF